VRVEGTTTFTPVAEQWFRCRLFLTDSPDVIDPQAGRFRNKSSPQVLAVLRDFDGRTLHFHGDQRAEIRSRQFGKAVWRMAGEPQPLRRRRRVIGWLLNTERVIEREYDDLLNQDVPNIYVPF